MSAGAVVATGFGVLSFCCSDALLSLITTGVASGDSRNLSIRMLNGAYTGRVKTLPRMEYVDNDIHISAWSSPDASRAIPSRWFGSSGRRKI